MRASTQSLRSIARPALACLLLALGAAPSVVSARDYVFDLDSTGSRVAIAQDHPEYPANGVRGGQEGWVQMSYVVTADGRAIDPIVLASSGGGAFEVEARKVIPNWRFEPLTSGIESPGNIVDIRSEVKGGRDAATAKFLRHTRVIMENLQKGDTARARTQADNAVKRGGWNLYESTILWLMLGRVEGAEGDSAGQLEMYRRALAVGNSNAISNASRIDLLQQTFGLQFDAKQYAAAHSTIESLRALSGSDDALERLAAQNAKVTSELRDNATIAADATIHNTCNCDFGEPLWHYTPARRSFSFANLTGNVRRFEARCESERISAAVETGKLWSLGDESGTCMVFVFGDADATFQFLEHQARVDESASRVAAQASAVTEQERD